MADISKEIQDFREAVYGEEVRGSMISLAEKVNGEVEDNTDKVTKYGEEEQSRAEAETARVNAEKARAEAENGRVSAEASRVSAENTRAGNEKARISAEKARAEAELARTNAESTRVSAESERATSELERETAESERETSESGRKTSEQGRVSAETDRVSAENARAEAETNRQANTEQAINDCDEATARANAAAEAAEGLVLGDISEKTVTFETALQRVNIQSGDSLAVAFGKLAKFCADLDSHAFVAPVNNLTGTDPSLPLAAPQGAVLKKEVDKLNSALETRTNGKVKLWEDSEGGNIQIESPNGIIWQLDCYNDKQLRLYNNNNGTLNPFYYFSEDINKGGTVATEKYVDNKMESLESLCARVVNTAWGTTLNIYKNPNTGSLAHGIVLVSGYVAFYIWSAGVAGSYELNHSIVLGGANTDGRISFSINKSSGTVTVKANETSGIVYIGA